VIVFNAMPEGHVIGGRFRIDQRIGTGKSSAVYRATDLKTQTTVCLKVLDPFLAQDPVNRERFDREAKVIRALEHPNIVKLYGTLNEGGFQILCMEFCEGLDAKTHVMKYGALSAADFLKVAPTIARAIQSCHQAGVLHRDIKPQNVLLGPGLVPKLVDFGISRINSMSDLTKTGTSIGTPEYMAPELFTHGRAEPRSDIYSLGALFYELLTERPPYQGTSLTQVMMRQASGAVTPPHELRPEIPGWLEAIVLRCLQLDPNRRYQSALELVLDLEAAADADARALLDRKPAFCFGCKFELIPGLVFCPGCGKFSHEVFERGPYSLVVNQCEDPQGVSKYLVQAFPHSKAERVRKDLKFAPRVLIKRVSEATAIATGNELSGLDCQVEVMRNLPSSLRLPNYYWLFLLAPVPAGLMLSAVISDRILPAGLGVSLASGLVMILLWVLYARRVRPVISLFRLRRSATASNLAELAQLAQAMRKINHPGLKMLIGNLVRLYCSVGARAGEQAAVDAQALRGLLDRSIETAGRLQAQEAYLGSTSLNAIKAEIDRVEARIRASKDAGQIDALLGDKTKYARELQRYYEIQDEHSRSYLSLTDFHAQLTQLEHELGRAA
jgi:hypothetical protein